MLIELDLNGDKSTVRVFKNVNVILNEETGFLKIYQDGKHITSYYIMEEE